MTTLINARALVEGDLVASAPVESVNPRGDFSQGRVIQVKSSWGQVFVWLEEGTDRPADLILNHGDPLTLVNLDGDPEPTLDGYEQEYLTMVAVRFGPTLEDAFGVGLDGFGNVVRFRKAEDHSLDTLALTLAAGHDITALVAECEVISRKPAFEVVGEVTV